MQMPEISIQRLRGRIAAIDVAPVCWPSDGLDAYELLVVIVGSWLLGWGQRNRQQAIGTSRLKVATVRLDPAEEKPVSGRRLRTAMLSA